MRCAHPGIYRDVDPAEYYADPCPEPSLTQSIAKILLEQSPLHARWAHPRFTAQAADDPEAYNKLHAIGNAAHKLVIQRGRDLCVLNYDSFRKQDAKDARDAATKEGKIPVLVEHFDIACGMHRALVAQLGHHEASNAFKTGSGEVMLVTSMAGLWFRSLVDWLSGGLLSVYDYKTTGESVAEHALASKAERDGWYIQAAAQEWMLDILDPDNAGRRRFYNVAQENYPPYAANVIEMSEAWLTMGRKKWMHAVQIWHTCITTGRWPGYPPHVLQVEFPGYAEARWLQREIREAARERVPAAPDLIMAG